MPPRRRRMRTQSRLDSASGRVRSGARVTVQAYAKRYGVDCYTAYDELTTIGFPLPASAARWGTASSRVAAQRFPAHQTVRRIR
jgi:hypothetical protein